MNKTSTSELSPSMPQQPAALKARAVTELAITGMSCANCARNVTEALQSVPGVQAAIVNLEGGAATVRWATQVEPDLESVIQSVKRAGFEAHVAELGPHGAHSGGELTGWRLNLALGIPVTLFLMVSEWGLGLGTARWYSWLAFALATAVQLVAGARFYRGAWGQLKVGSSNMDTLVALGSTTAYAYSTWALLSGQGGHLYFMEAASITTLISLGHWIESHVSAKASSALSGLLNLTPALARRLATDGTEREVPVADLSPGDLIGLRPGDRVPTDGTVVEGGSAVDESMLTGESVPVDKTPGDELFGGTVNVNGRITMRVTAVGEETALANIIAAVRRAQTSRANIQRLGDRVSNVFVPIVVSVAVAAALWWWFAPESALRVQAWLGTYLWDAHPIGTPAATAFIIAAAVLIIACPCAMGLATPAAIMAGSNAAAERGILIRDGVALEKAGRVTAVVLDKTGTLTAGKPILADQWLNSASQLEGPDALELALALSRHSTHPVSRAIAAGISSVPGGARARNAGKDTQMADWQEVRGAGLQARLPSATAASIVRLGSLRWLEDQGVDLKLGAAHLENWSRQGATIVGLSLDAGLLALFAVKDALKPGAARVVAQLQRRGLKTYLATGDNALTAATIAAEVGIPADRVFSQVRPERKADLVKDLQKQGHRVAFVGDGINDAPALEQADLGIAVSRASDIAREAADIILLNSEIEAVPESLGLAKATLKTIKQNLFWAFFYNAVGVPLAALGFMSPILCAAAMGFSDLIVIGNALRLRRWRA